MKSFNLSLVATIAAFAAVIGGAGCSSTSAVESNDIGDHADQIEGTFTTCDGAPETVKSYSITPDQPRLSAPVTTPITIDVKTRIVQGAKTVTTAKIGIFTAAQTTRDFCEESAKVGFPCPIEPGIHTIPFVQTAPAATPAFVTLSINSNATNADGSTIFCINTKLKFIP